MWFIYEYINEVINLTNEMSASLLLGFFIAGVLYVYIPQETIVKFFNKKNFTSVINAALLGIPLPLCSCGVIPTGISFYKNGASKSASVSFLISTPQTGVDSILVTWSMLGAPFAIIRPAVAFIAGILGGTLMNWFDNEKLPITKTQINEAAHNEPTINFNNKLKKILQYGFITFFSDIAFWLVVGILLAAFISILIPDNFFTEYIPNNFIGMLVMLAISVPLYVCATASIPIAAAFITKGFSLGAAFVFLMAGPATNIATITVLTKVFGRRTLLIYLVAITISALFFGWLIDLIIPNNYIKLNTIIQHNHYIMYVNSIASIILLILLLYTFYKNYFIKNNKSPIKNINIKTYIVKEIKCNTCKLIIEKNLMKIKGITYVNADINSNILTVKGTDINDLTIKEIINKLGYRIEF